ncbi:PD-(D/E)XK nuclease family protein [Domibacillus sp. PGB-M46]|uniref:PD-(D/E)XK nuclease family protein n=1 Tax=Domibacillus sp. PGB-M46 TaxID=2910255 RepID=UPI001F5668AF|nr:PD-(D/E)XK nuclease family protein [Domibacillus sp. PGB-M46]MCI2253392.1 PD-(D/E)XK nuclease family protein [Domibacillus sp. PGB-M46]
MEKETYLDLGCGEQTEDRTAYPQVIADRGDALLLLYSHDQGRVYIKNENKLYAAMYYKAILKSGCWNEYRGENVAAWINAYAEKVDEPKSLFQFAASELSQDAFLCWFAQWAAPYGKTADEVLHKCALLFLGRMFKKHGEALPEVKSIGIIQQFQGMDVLLLVNDHAAVLIEDKMNTGDHSDQLTRYLEAVQKTYPHRKPLPIYYKPAGQSHDRPCDKAGYAPFLREDMIDVLNEGKRAGITNHIFLDYLKWLEEIEAGYQSYRWLPVSAWTPSSWQGFYRLLQRKLQNGNWSYVANMAGGFEGFWWAKSSKHACYFQLEQSRLCIKLAEPDPLRQREARMKTFARLLEQPAVKDLAFEKPGRPQNGKTMTIMVKNDYLQTNEDGTINVEATIHLLKEVEEKVAFF